MASAAVTAFAVVGFAAGSATRGSRYTNHVRPTWVGPRSGLEVRQGIQIARVASHRDFLQAVLFDWRSCLKPRILATLTSSSGSILQLYVVVQYSTVQLVQ